MIQKQIHKEIYYADIETTKFKDDLDYESIDFPEFILSCTIKLNDTFDSISDKYSFKSVKDMNDFFTSKSSKQKIVYFHNLSFDSKFFLYDLYKSGLFEIEIIKIQSKILQIAVFRKNAKKRKIIVKFVDSLSLLLKSVKDLGTIVNLPKLDFDFDYSNPEQMKKAITYCYRDCEIVFRAYLSIIDYVKDTFPKMKDVNELNISKLPLTIGSLSKKCFKSIYPEAYQRHNTYHDRYLRKYFFGGRVEIFDFSKENADCYDVNSEYPHCLANYDYANGGVLRINIRDDDNYTIESFMNDKSALGIEALITEKNIHFPYFPVKIYDTNKNNSERKSYKVYFPLGNKQVFITKRDIRFFQEKGMLNKSIIINQIIAIYNTENITNFKDFINPLYEKKISYEHSHPLVFFSKIFLNSSYGKFGQSTERDKFILISSFDEVDLDTQEIFESSGILFEKQTYIQAFQDDNLINAVLTTSYGRLELYKWMIDFTDKGYKLKYVDTDSVFIKPDLTLPIPIISNLLGGIKLEYSAIDFQAIDCKEYHCKVFNPKNQLDEFKLKHKGLQLKRMTEMSNLKEYYDKGIHNLIVPTMFYCLSRHTNIEATFTIKKSKHSYYNKRKINSDLTTKPISMNEVNGSYITKNKNIISRILNNL